MKLCILYALCLCAILKQVYSHPHRHNAQQIILAGDQDPCKTAQCGPNSQCRNIGDIAQCSCLPGYFGSPPGCKPECSTSFECAEDKGCFDQKCQNPCLSIALCGYNTECRVIRHSPLCNCLPNYFGDAFERCDLKKDQVAPGVPGAEFNSTLVNGVVIRRPCRNATCGSNAKCEERNGVETCICEPEYFGDPYVGCRPELETKVQLCDPFPCGSNARCVERNGAGTCVCIGEYFGDPYIGCRPECVSNEDCVENKACSRNECHNPCLENFCGENAVCNVVKHAPVCTCIQGYTGEPESCHQIRNNNTF